MYYDLVPHASFNVMYLKNLFHTFREKGAVLNSIYDPTGGWGGTLLSAAISGFNTIIDNDRSPTVFEPKQGLVEFLLRQHYPSGSTPNIILMNKDITESPGPLLPFQVDIICNSPPFFKYEKYAVENGVNHDVNLGLKPIQNWIEVFCRPLVYHAAYYLRYGGIFAIQISNLSGAESIVQQFIWMANVTGLFDERPEKLHYSYMGKKPNYFYVFRKKLRIEFPITHVSSMQPESKKRDLDALQISCDCDTVGLFFRSENSNNTAITVNNRVSSQPRKRLQLSSLSGLQVVL
jgi:hypothetical protein